MEGRGGGFFLSVCCAYIANLEDSTPVAIIANALSSTKTWGGRLGACSSCGALESIALPSALFGGNSSPFN